MPLRIVISIAIVAIMAGCANCGRNPAVDCTDPIAALFCEEDSDCRCGVSKTTGDCAYGALACIDETEQCPDFCAGIAGNLTIECHQGICQQVTLEP